MHQLWTHTPLHTRTQHPVGHGFFHDGAILGRDSVDFRYIYDCGGRTRPALDRWIEIFPGKRVDALFISHLHYDHVSGLPRLLARQSVERAYLPHLSELERILVAVRCFALGVLDTEYFRFLRDPEVWLLDHGVGTVFSLRPSTRPPPDIPAEPPQLADHGGLLVSHFIDGVASNPPAGAHIVEDLTITAQLDGRLWILRPHVQSASDESLATLRAALGLVSTAKWGSSDWVISQLESRTSLRRLRGAYQRAFVDINVASLMLLVAPVGGARLGRAICVRGKESITCHPGMVFDTTRMGWLATGDAKLNTEDAVDELAFALGKYVRSIGTVSLPHHGSRHNFHSSLLSKIGTDGLLTFATAKSRGKKHPSDSVVRRVAELGAAFHVVTEEATTSLREELFPLEDRGR